MTTLERIARVEEQVSNVDKKVDGVSGQVKDLNTKMDDFLDKLDKRYASKLSEKIVYALVGLVLVAFATGIINDRLNPTHQATAITSK